MRGNCQVRSIVHKATVTRNDKVKEYIGLSEPQFKQRFANHKTSFQYEKYENSTEWERSATVKTLLFHCQLLTERELTAIKPRDAASA